METLLVEADRRDNEILRSLVKRIDPDLPLTGRIAMFTGQRARILEQMTPTWRAARLHEPFSAELARNKAWTLAKAKTELETVFTPELGEARRVSGASSCSTACTRSASGHSGSRCGPSSCSAPEQAEDLFRATFTGLLGAAGFA